MLVAFMGLTGPLECPPYQYTELLMGAPATRTCALDFLDIFNHRMLSLFYRVWRSTISRLPTAIRADPFTAFLFDIIGLGTNGLRGRLPFKDQGLLRCGGLIAQRPPLRPLGQSAVTTSGWMQRWSIPG
jgi:type VI secretion system protein ImpH